MEVKLRSIDGYDDFGHYYISIAHLVKSLNCSIYNIMEVTGLNYRTVRKLISGANQRCIENKTIERICFCFQCKPEDFCFYVPPKEQKRF